MQNNLFIHNDTTLVYFARKMDLMILGCGNFLTLPYLAFFAHNRESAWPIYVILLVLNGLLLMTLFTNPILLKVTSRGLWHRKIWRSGQFYPWSDIGSIEVVQVQAPQSFYDKTWTSVPTLTIWVRSKDWMYRSDNTLFAIRIFQSSLQVPLAKVIDEIRQHSSAASKLTSGTKTGEIKAEKKSGLSFTSVRHVRSWLLVIAIFLPVTGGFALVSLGVQNGSLTDLCLGAAYCWLAWSFIWIYRRCTGEQVF